MAENVTNARTSGPVMVGVDGSTSSWDAIVVAAREARERHAGLCLVHGYYETVPYASFGWVPYNPALYDALGDARGMLDAVATRARTEYPDLTVTTELRAGGGARTLIELSSQAGLIVVGARGHGGFAGLSIGSVAAQVAAYAHTPVIVVRESKGAVNGPVVVGVDGSAQSDAALGFAFEEAQARGVSVVAIYSWWTLPSWDLVARQPIMPGTGDPSVDNDIIRQARADADRVLAESLANWSPKFPAVAVDARAEQSMNPSYTLIEASRDASLVVVGSRGRGGFAGLVLGSVGRDLVGHALCPVAVVHERSRRDEATA